MRLLDNLEQLNIPPVDFFTALATIGLLSLVALATATAPLVAVTSEVGYRLRKKAFLDKCAMQISQSALVNAVFIFFALLAWVCFLNFQNRPGPLQDQGILDQLVVFSPLFAALLLLALYAGTWQRLKKNRNLHIFIGIVQAILFLALFFAACLLAANVQQPTLTDLLLENPLGLLQTLLGDFLTTPHMWAMVAYLFCTGAAFAMALAQVWLVLRRHRADYGRDYYAYAMRYCAGAALAFTVPATILAGLVYWLLRQTTPPELTQPHDAAILLIAAGLPLCCCLLWLAIAKSPMPMRHKPGVVFGLVFSYLTFCAQLLMLMTTFPVI